MAWRFTTRAEGINSHSAEYAPMCFPLFMSYDIIMPDMTNVGERLDYDMQTLYILP